jgi:phosphoketolase
VVSACLANKGAIVVSEHQGQGEPVLLIATGAYQLGEMLRAARRLSNHDHTWRLVYLQEPGRFTTPRDDHEAACSASREEIQTLFPAAITRRVMLTHMRPEIMRGHLSDLLPDPTRSRVLGYINQGGTFDQAGMLFANRCTWAQVLASVGGIGNPTVLR